MVIEQNKKLNKVEDPYSINGYVWVEDTATFKKLARSWLTCDYLAIDTEFERRTTYYPILALVQVYDGDKIYLIDPFKVECPEEFKALCANESIIKIMHSAREDLEVFYYSWGCQLRGLFDTQIAYAFLNGEMSKGYAALVETFCNQVLDKQETQSDWKKRPLSDKQLEYAAKDVVYLPNIYQFLIDLLKQKTFFHLFKQECDELCLLVIRQPDYEIDYRQAKDVWRLDGQQLVLFKKLYEWREQTAIKDNRTKNHILKDPELVQIALLQPKSKTALQKINDFHPRSFRLYALEIIQLVESFKTEQTKLTSIPNPRDVNGLNQLSDKLLSAVHSEASHLGITAGLLASKRLIKKMAFAEIVGESSPEILEGWRGEILKPLFNPIVTQFISSDHS